MNVNVSVIGRSRILICSHDAETLRVMSNVFSSLAAYDTEIESIDQFISRETFDPESFDMVIIDVGDGSVLDNDVFRTARERIGKTPVIFISEALGNDRMRQLIKLDGIDWLPKPIQSRVLIDTVNAQIQKISAGGNMVHAVLSCGGGAGGTTVAIMLAHYLARARKRVRPTAALFDLDFSTAASGAYLNIPNSYDIKAITFDPERVDVEFIDIIKKKHASGFSLFSFECPDVVLSPRGTELVLRMLDVVAFQHDHTVVDIPAYETSWKERVIGAVNSAVIVTNLSVPALQHAKDTFERVIQIRGDQKDLSIMINKSRSGFFGSRIGRKGIEKIFGEIPVSILPEEQSVMEEALNRGVLPNEVNSRSRFCAKIAELAEKMRVIA
jgi:pilus assembly protein CpaE